MVTYSKTCHESVGEDGKVLRKTTYDTQDECADEVVKWEEQGTLHNETFVGVRTRGVSEGLVDLGSAECTASSLDFGRIWKSAPHLTDEIFKAWSNTPIPLGGCLVEGDTPCDGVTTDRLLGHLALRHQIEFCPHDDNWYGLMEGEGGSDRESGRRRRGDGEMESSR